MKILDKLLVQIVLNKRETVKLREKFSFYSSYYNWLLVVGLVGLVKSPAESINSFVNPHKATHRKKLAGVTEKFIERCSAK